MDKDKLENKLKNLNIPAPDESKKKAAMMAATAQFERHREEAKKNIKGSESGERLTGKNWLKGGFAMNRPIIATASVAALALLISISIIPVTMKKGKVEVDISRTLIKPQHQPKMLDETSSVPEKTIVTAKAELAESSKDLKKIGVRENEIGSANAGRGQEVKRAAIKREAFKAKPLPTEERVMEAKAVADATMPEPMAEPEPIVESFYIPSTSAPLAKKAAKIKSALKGERSAGLVATSPMAYSDQITMENMENQEYTGRDKFESKAINPIKLTAKEPLSTFSIDVDTASYSFVRRALLAGHLPQKDAVRVEEMINYFDYNYEVPHSRKEPFKATVAVYPTPWNKKTKLMHIGIKGHEIVKEMRPTANLVFLVDVSGSMGMPDKLPLLKNSLKMLVGELGPKDKVSIVVYAGAAGTVLEPTSATEKGKIIAALDRLQSGGSTAGGEGIRLAYSLAEANFDKDGVNRIILATDGDFNVGIRNPEELKGFVERKRESGVFLSVLGFGQGNYNDTLMQKLAQNGNGNAAYIDSLSEARKVLVDEAGSTLFTIAKDVKIQVEFNPDRVAEYRLIGYETRMLKREDFNNDKVDAGDIGAGHSVTAIYEITPVGSSGRLVDDLRYNKENKGKKGEKTGEYAFLKIRYKLPEENQSRLITTPVDSQYEQTEMTNIPEDIRFAASVSAFSQILKGGTYTGSFTYKDVLSMAEKTRGSDRFGYRSEFLNLVRLAETAAAMGRR